MAKAYPISYALREPFRNRLSKWIEWGIIIEQCSPYNKTIHVLLKFDEVNIRPVLDMRFIKDKIIAPRIQVETIQEILHRLSKAVVFSAQDLKGALYSLSLHPDSYSCTAFKFEGRQYCFRFLSMRMKTSCALFQTTMNQLFSMYTKDIIAVYFVDVLVFSESIEEQFQHLSSV